MRTVRLQTRQTFLASWLAGSIVTVESKYKQDIAATGCYAVSLTQQGCFPEQIFKLVRLVHHKPHR
jgi:hypothetical protein